MRYRMPSNKQMRRLCAEPGEEDGLDPRLGAPAVGPGRADATLGGGPAFGPGSPAHAGRPQGRAALPPGGRHARRGAGRVRR